MARTPENPMTTTRKQSMQLALQKVRAGAVRHVPILSWARSYPAAWLRPDLISAATGWGLMVPVAIAYAELAGVPAEVGLYTAFAGLLVAAALFTGFNEGNQNWQSMWTCAIYLLLALTLWRARAVQIPK
jgi:hypothetical protein